MSKIATQSLEDLESQIREIQVDYNYRLADFTIGELIKKFRQPENNQVVTSSEDDEMSFLVVPKYQRNFVWSQKMQSEFIESIFMGVPIQPLFAFELDDEGNMELLDGVQRLSSIKAFCENELILGELDAIDTLNGYSFSELEIARRRKFLNTLLKVYIINELASEGVRADIFRRVNEGGEKLKSAEIRKGKFLENTFYDFILQCTENETFNRLFRSGKDDNKSRGEKEELVTRFFAYSDDYESFQHSVKGFLDSYIISKANFNSTEADSKMCGFVIMLNFVELYIPNGFGKLPNSKSIPRVRFEAIAIGANLALKENPKLANPSTQWLESQEFKRNTTSDAANSKIKLKNRIEFVRDCLLSTIDVKTLTYES